MQQTAENPISLGARFTLKATGQVFYRAQSAGCGNEYAVEVEHGFGVTCTCPEFSKRQMCPHIRAVTQREAERNMPAQKKAEARAAKHIAPASEVAEKMQNAPLNSSWTFRILR